MNSIGLFIVFISFLTVIFPINVPAQKKIITTYEPTWNSMKNWRTPQWLRDGKFGIYTHWGVYSVPARGPNPTWYANKLYTKEDGPERKYHEATFGPLEKFGYKDSYRRRIFLPGSAKGILIRQLCYGMSHRPKSGKKPFLSGTAGWEPWFSGNTTKNGSR